MMPCKFCTVFNTAGGNEASYENLTEAVMQIALMLASKHRTGKNLSYNIITIMYEYEKIGLYFEENLIFF